MFAHSRRHAPAPVRRPHRFILAPAALGVLLLAACTARPPVPVAGVHPADPDAGAWRAAYRPVIGPYASERPRDPSGWQQNNERVAPQEKP